METLFFWASKLLWLLISPDSLLVLLALAGTVQLFRGAYNAARKILGATAAMMLILALFPVGEWLLYPLEKRFATNPALPEKVDGIIVLGGSKDAFLSTLWQQVELSEAAERDIAFMRLMRRYPDAVHVFTGGSGNIARQQFKEAHAARELFGQLGFDTAKIRFEERSRNTFENAAFTRELVRPEPGGQWVLITSAGHMPRSVGIFKKARWPVIAYPVDHQTKPGHLLRFSMDFAKNLRILKIALKEWVGLTAYYFTGKTDAFLPSPG